MSGDPQPERNGGPSDQHGFAAMFEGHAEHLFDYCKELIGDSSTAAEVTEAAIVAAQAVLLDPEKLRAWLFALARANAVNSKQLRAGDRGDEQGSGVRSADVADQDEAVTETFSVYDVAATDARTPGQPYGREREVLDLVYRHGILPGDLPAILGLPSGVAQDLLDAAEAKFAGATPTEAGHSSGAGDAAGTATGRLEQRIATPLAPLPESVRRRASEAEYADSRDRRPDDPGRSRHRAAGDLQFERARRRVRTAAIALLPIAAAVAAVVYFAAPSTAQKRDDQMASVSSGHTRARTRASATAGLDPPRHSGHGRLRKSGRHLSVLLPGSPAEASFPVPGSVSASATSPASSLPAITGPPTKRPKPSKSPKPSPSSSTSSGSGSPSPTVSPGESGSGTPKPTPS
jgi:DNA-directed RNA polymerase specialized sigma24 family protein